MIEILLHRPVAAEFPISSKYGPRVHPKTGEVGKMHYGIDFAVPEGTPVVASLNGTIYRAGWENIDNHKQGFGLRVWQKCLVDMKLVFIAYAHLSEISLKENDYVTAGERIGLSGNTGGSSGPHLHHEGRVGGIYGVKGTPLRYMESVA